MEHKVTPYIKEIVDINDRNIVFSVKAGGVLKGVMAINKTTGETVYKIWLNEIIP